VFVVLDEAFASLDDGAERTVLAGLHGVGVTTLSVTHRPHAVLDTARISVALQPDRTARVSFTP
jgi:ABC-type bacteriocin/lantibiotic exporter with double-glycine peptidase domain